MATRYWVASLPVGQGSSASSIWSRLQESISKQAFDTSLYRFNIPNLRVGTLDSLLALSDDLLKANLFIYFSQANSFIEGVSHKIRRQIEELERVSGVVSSSLTVDGVPVDSYLTRQLIYDLCRFVWDEAKYPTMSPLKELVDGIHVQIAKIEDDLKVRVAEYNNVRSQLNAINRKQAGSLAVRDLSNLVKPQDIISSEHLTTLLAIVPKYSQKDWLSSYETLTTYVVPRSSKKLHEDNEYALYTVTLFSRDADNFRTKAREINFQIRDFEYSPETQESRKQELEKLMQDQETLRSSLLQWCYTSYGEVFSSWMHFCAVRVFSESVLRYGLPPSFLSVVLSPPVKSEKKVRSILEGLCSSSNSTFWKTEDEGGMGGFAGDADAHPYLIQMISHCSLAVRDLSNLVKPQDIISSEHLTTLLAIVPKYSQKDWLSSYETLTTYVVSTSFTSYEAVPLFIQTAVGCAVYIQHWLTNYTLSWFYVPRIREASLPILIKHENWHSACLVPRSSKKLHEDNEYALYTVTLFSRDADNFRTKAREINFQIRDFEYSPETQESRKQELEKLMQDQETLRSSLLQWCYTSYGEVFSSWMHFCAVRVFSESVLRYGLPPSFLSVVLSPPVKSEKKVRSILEGLCSSSNR
ncbi:hypothetical protein Pfo_011773 [Paulownia fortunei]|nr:hypothetical protein Pfo_011773 [Paulownia fortunei]